MLFYNLDFDEDGDGYVTVNELGKLMAGMGDKMTRQEAEDMLRLIDKNKDGCIEYKGRWWVRKCQPRDEPWTKILPTSEFFSIVTKK